MRHAFYVLYAWAAIAILFSGSTNARAQSPDVTPPTIDFLSPRNLQVVTNVWYCSYSLTFSEPIQKGEGKIFVKRASDNVAVLVIDFSNNFTDNLYTISEKRIAITAPEVANTMYYILIEPTAIKDLAGNYFQGFPDSSYWTFTLGPTACRGPLVSSLYPANNSTVSPDTDHALIKFDTEVGKGAGYIVLRRVSDGLAMVSLLVTSDAVEVAGNTARIKFNYSTLPQDEYYIEIPNTAFKDVAW